MIDTIKRRTQSGVASCIEDVIEAIKGYTMTYDKANIIKEPRRMELQSYIHLLLTLLTMVGAKTYV